MDRKPASFKGPVFLLPRRRKASLLAAVVLVLFFLGANWRLSLFLDVDVHGLSAGMSNDRFLIIRRSASIKSDCRGTDSKCQVQEQPSLVLSERSIHAYRGAEQGTVARSDSPKNKPGGEATGMPTLAGQPTATASTSPIESPNLLDIAVCMTWGVRKPPSIAKAVRYLLESPGLARDKFGIFVWQSWPARDDRQTHAQLVELGARIYQADDDYTMLKGKVRTTRGDPLDQMRWRLRHVLDYANLLERCAGNTRRFLLMIEDDVLPAKYSIRKALDFGRTYLTDEEKDWFYATMYSGVKRTKEEVDITKKDLWHGTVSLLFHRKTVKELAAYLRREAVQWPADLLIQKFFLDYVPQAGLGQVRVLQRTPNIFQHASAVSTYTGVNPTKRLAYKLRSVTFRLDEDDDPSQRFPPRQGDKYIGCFHDNLTNPTTRDLSGKFYMKKEKARSSSFTSCRRFCIDYLYFGVQDGGDCYCGNEFGRHGVAPQEACSMRCSNEELGPCGGEHHNSVYAV